MNLHCIIKDCDREADGIVMLNHNDMEITLFMIPSCTDHAQTMQHTNFAIELRLDANPIVTIGDTNIPGISSDLSFTFDSF